MPISIQIQTIDYCNRKCPWCPNSKIEKQPTSLMSWSIYFKIIEDLRKIHYGGAIHPYMMGEPLCDPRMPEMIHMANKFFPDNVIFISTNGDYLKRKEDVKDLFDKGLTWMGVSHYDDRNDHLKKMVEFPRMVHTPIEKLRETFYNRAGNIDVPCIHPMKSCDWIFQKAYINYRGDVILCCSDYKYEIVFGNVMDQPFGEIYNSENYNYYRKAHRQGWGKELPLCEKCNRIEKEETKNVRNFEENRVL